MRILPLGGLGEIGRNMTVIEWGRQMIVIDCGVMFPDSDLPGIDLVLPDFSYVVERKQHLLGVVVTHAHQDHVGQVLECQGEGEGDDELEHTGECRTRDVPLVRGDVAQKSQQRGAPGRCLRCNPMHASC